MTIQRIKEEVRKLSRPEQVDFMHYIIGLLTVDDFVLSEIWKKELDEREKALGNGRYAGKPFMDVLLKYKRNE